MMCAILSPSSTVLCAIPFMIRCRLSGLVCLCLTLCLKRPLTSICTSESKLLLQLARVCSLVPRYGCDLSPDSACVCV